MVLKKLRRRFIIINMCLVSIVLVGIFLANTISTARQVALNSYSYLNDDKRHITALHRDVYEPKKEIPPKAFPQDIIWLRVDNDNVLVLNQEAAPAYTDEHINEIVATALNTGKAKGILREHNLRFDIFKTPNDEIVIGFIDVSYEQKFVYVQITNYLLTGLGSLIVFFVISFFLSKIVIKPVDKAFKQQQQFISDASHELKTPITVILANTSIILNKKDNNNARKWVNYIDKEANRMKKLVEDLLFLARLDENGNIALNSKFNLSDALYECVLPFEPVAFENSISINNDISPNVFIKGNVDQIKRLIMILLDNACKYSPNDNAISITLKSLNGKANLSIHNKGPSIPEEDISKIFDRFYRVDKARERNSNSYGLGLPMAKEIVRHHKGNISVTSTENEGTTFSIVLPTCNA